LNQARGDQERPHKCQANHDVHSSCGQRIHFLSRA
jgi:hypothetical protein